MLAFLTISVLLLSSPLIRAAPAPEPAPEPIFLLGATGALPTIMLQGGVATTTALLGKAYVQTL